MPSRGLLAASAAVATMVDRGRFKPVLATPGRGASAAAVPSGVAATAAAPHALVLAHFATYCSRPAVVSVPATALKLSSTKRLLAEGNLNNTIFARVGSSFHFATNKAIKRSSETGEPAAVAPAVVVTNGLTPAVVVTTGLIPPIIVAGGLGPPSDGMPAAVGTNCTGNAGISTSSRGMGSGAPDSLRCASTSCKSIFKMSSRHVPALW
mmetsp:Transcript_68225/g.171941  ORF Transcript_68225/g.171941 Transcript_68225/m.171941 type:complete len:209 (+) Transcript_68225:390-1016(+)